MTMKSSVTIARTLEVSEITANGSFDHGHVFDLRCCEEAGTRPIEELVLKRLDNHFIQYDQMPLNMDELEESDAQRFGEAIEQRQGNTLVVTDNVPQVARLCTKFGIPFTSKVFYVVETGKGEVIRSVVDECPRPSQFGAFAG